MGLEKRSYRTELYIILIALILALITIGVFWIRNKGETVPNNSASASIVASSNSVTQPDPENNPSSTPKEQPKPIRFGLTRILEKDDVNILVLGDSIGMSKGASDPNQTGWTSLVAQDLQALYPGQSKWTYKTGEGFTANNIQPLIPEIGADSDVVLLCFGRSDSSKIRLTDFKRKYQEIIQSVRAKVPQADIYLLVEPPVKNIQSNNRYFPYRQVILDLGQQNQIKVIDQWASFVNSPEPLQTLLVTDQVYPSDKGYRLFADAVSAAFKEYLDNH